MAQESEKIGFATWILTIMALILLLWVGFLVTGLEEKADRLEVMVRALQGDRASEEFTRTFSHGDIPSEAADGTSLYCPDCTRTTPCAGGGSGAIAVRLGGAWDCKYAEGLRRVWGERFVD